MADEQTRCIFCDNPVTDIGSGLIRGNLLQCPNCGDYQLTHEALHDLPTVPGFRENRHLVAGYIREMNESGKPVIHITLGGWEQTLAAAQEHAPKNADEIMLRLLQYVVKHRSSPGMPTSVNCRQPALIYGHGMEDMLYYLKGLEQVGLARVWPTNMTCPVILTMEGERFIQDNASDKRQAKAQEKMPSSGPTVVVQPGAQVGQINMAQDNATIHATSTFTANDLSQCAKLLNELIQTLEQDSAVPEDDKAEALDILHEAKDTLAAPQPRVRPLEICKRTLTKIQTWAVQGTQLFVLAKQAFDTLVPIAQQIGDAVGRR